MAGPGHVQLVLGLGKWAAACVLAYLVGMSPGVGSRFLETVPNGPISGQGRVAALYHHYNILRTVCGRPSWLFAVRCCKWLT